MSRQLTLGLLLLAIIGGAQGCTDFQSDIPEPAPLWPAADSLLQRDDSWVGGDGAYSIDLGNGRVLWTFGDSWVNPDGEGTREDGIMVSNTIGIQHGYDPEAATMSFYWGGMDTGSPTAFLPDEAGLRFWPGHGAMVGGKLILFWMEVSTEEGGIGFAVQNWRANLISNPGDDPSEWQSVRLDTPRNDRRIIVGSGGVLVHDGYLYAHGAREPGPNHSVFLVRWPEADAAQGELTSNMQWWGGEEAGWLDGPEASANAQPVATDVQTEFTVHHDADASRFQLTHSSGFGQAVIVARYADHITGPWSAPDTLVVPPHNDVENIMIYQGKAHPYLEGGDLVLTYSTNSFDFGDHFRKPWLYYPRFARNTH